MGTTAWFATREDIRSALDASEAARSDAQLDRALDAASRAVVGLCNRAFVPTLATRVFDWPSDQTPRSWQLWLNQHDLIAPTLVTSAGVTVPPSDYYLEPANSGPPYTHVVTRLDKPSAWSAGDTWQHALSITGWWGYTDDQVPAGTLTAAINATTSSVPVSDSSLVGVGHIITCGTERMTVTSKRLTDTGQTVQTPLGDLNNEVLVDVTDGTTFHEGEYIVVGAEWMLITAITGDTLIVTRAVNGSVLDTHSGTAIYAPRLLTVARAAAGTTAQTATSGTAITRWAPPGLVHTLCVAEAQNWLLQEQAGYLRTAGAGSGTSGGKEATLEALKDLRDQCYTAHGRKARIRAV